MNPHFQELSAAIKVKLTLSISLFNMHLQDEQSDFKSEYLFRTCSVATNLVTSLNNPFHFAVLLCYAVLTNYATVPYSLHSFSSNATSEYGIVPERPDRNKEQTRNTPGSSTVILQVKRSKLTCAFLT